MNWKNRNCSSSLEGQGLGNHHLHCSIEPGEPEEGGTVLRGGLLGTAGVYHL